MHLVTVGITVGCCCCCHRQIMARRWRMWQRMHVFAATQQQNAMFCVPQNHNRQRNSRKLGFYTTTRLPTFVCERAKIFSSLFQRDTPCNSAEGEYRPISHTGILYIPGIPRACASLDLQRFCWCFFCVSGKWNKNNIDFVPYFFQHRVPLFDSINMKFIFWCARLH